VVSIDAVMDLQEEFLAQMGRDAFHQHSHRRWAALVKLANNGDICPSASGNPSVLDLVSWEDLVEKIGQERCPQVGVVYRGVDC
jgi:hypothetical protein